jgi:fructose-1,6-bisphosphatase/inositol monophosphatase family enzyme
LVDLLDRGPVWIVDPIDGTGNYAAGRPPFALMVAFAVDGDVLGGWIFDPIADRMLSAFAGEGAFANGERVFAQSTGAAKPLLALATRFLPADVRTLYEARAADGMTRAEIPMCAGEQYARLALGVNDVALFWRAHAWDHAPGGLFLEEAGGRLARFDGSDYNIGSRDTGLLAAATPQLWDQAARILLD